MSDQIADTGVALKSRDLEGKHLFFGVTGSIGAVEAVKLIRELRRHGARITPVLTAEGARFITPLSLEWAADTPVIQALSAKAEHLRDSDGLIVCPATWNFMVSVATGLACDALTTLAAITIARRTPTLIVPTLNDEFLKHPRFSVTLETLKSWGVECLLGDSEESRIKMPSPESFAAWVRECFR